MNTIRENLESIRSNIEESINKSNRNDKEVTLIAVTKTVDVDKVHMIHSLDREALCEEIQKRAEKIDRTISCLVQVNISKEDSKHGLYEDDVVEFIKNVSSKYSNIKVKGLMTMAPFSDDESEVRNVFKKLKDLSIDIEKLNIPNVSMDYLSMGMSNDYKIAIEEGSTIVRVGTSIFGERNYNK